MIETWNLANGVLKFEEETHTYWFNDKKCISVTQILHKLFPDKYSGIDTGVLKKAASRGTEIHNSVEVYETLGLKRDDLQEFRDYLFLKEYYKLEILLVELPIVITYKDLVIAGRLDGILREPIDDFSYRNCLYDIKTTAMLDKLYLSMQESLYRYGYKQSYGDIALDIEGLRAFHLKKGIRKYVAVDPCDVEVLLDKYIEILKEEKENEA